MDRSTATRQGVRILRCSQNGRVCVVTDTFVGDDRCSTSHCLKAISARDGLNGWYTAALEGDVVEGEEALWCCHGQHRDP